MYNPNFALSEGRIKEPRMPEALKAGGCKYPLCEVFRMKIRVKPWSLNNLVKKNVSHLNTVPRLFAPVPAPQGFPSCSPVLSVLRVGSDRVAVRGGLHWRSMWPPAGRCPPGHRGPRAGRWPWRGQPRSPHAGPGVLRAGLRPCFTVSLTPSLPGDPQ